MFRNRDRKNIIAHANKYRMCGTKRQYTCPVPERNIIHGIPMMDIVGECYSQSICIDWGM